MGEIKKIYIAFARIIHKQSFMIFQLFLNLNIYLYSFPLEFRLLSEQ